MAKRRKKTAERFVPSPSMRFFENPRLLPVLILALLLVMTVSTICMGFAAQGGGEDVLLEASSSPVETSAEPVAEPSTLPTAMPSAAPSAAPSPESSAAPSSEPAAEPSAQPDEEAVDDPSAEPSEEPTEEPSVEPASSEQPDAEQPPEVSAEPSVQPSAEPSAVPSAEPSPAVEPSATQSSAPSATPSAVPSAVPSDVPAAPSPEPSPEPDEQSVAEEPFDGIYLPIIKLHHFVEDGEYCNDDTITRSKFEWMLDTLEAHGYTTISAAQLIAWRNGNGTLPEKPVMLTLDDGYRSNYTIAYPIIRAHSAHAIVATVGWSVGRTSYLNEEYSIFPHFSWSEAAVMASDGGIEICSHTYNMHGSSEEPGGNGRYGMGRHSEETEEEYYAQILGDLSEMESQIAANLGKTSGVFVYPYGKYDGTSERVLDELKIPVSLITVQGMNKLERGDSLRKLMRFGVKERTDFEAMVSGWDAEYYTK